MGGEGKGQGDDNQLNQEPMSSIFYNNTQLMQSVDTLDE